MTHSTMYYLVVLGKTISGKTDINVYGPYDTGEDRDAEAKEMYADLKLKNGTGAPEILYGIMYNDGSLKIGRYVDGFLSGEQQDV